MSERVSDNPHGRDNPQRRDDWDDGHAAARAERDMLKARLALLLVEPVVAFGLWCLQEMRHPAPGDIDGGAAQDEAKRLGILVEIVAQEPCGDNCACAEYHGEFPSACLRESAAVAVLREKEER